MTGRGVGGSQPEECPTGENHLLHHGGGQLRQARHRPGGSLQALLGHPGRLLHQPPPSCGEGQAVRGEPWDVVPRR